MSARTRRSNIQAEINVTPLVDVVLVLLIIFMVVMPQAEAGIPLELPGILSPANKESELEPVTVSVKSDGSLFLEKARLDRAALRTELQKIRSADPKRRVVIRGDRATKYSEIRRVFKEAQDIGFPGVMLQVVAKSNGTKES
ncbi:MAG: biopolymer transporter ExbD [Myxococcaceae bacterium]